jgi:hypothetical protein
MATGTIRTAKLAPLAYYSGLTLLLAVASLTQPPRVAADWIADALLSGAEVRASALPLPPQASLSDASAGSPVVPAAAPPAVAQPETIEIASAAASGSSWPSSKSIVGSGGPSRFGTNAVASTTVTFQQGQGTGPYSGTQDTFVHQNFATTVEGSVVSWKWDTEDPAGFQAFGLIRFDNIFGASAGQIPVGSTITSATLTLVSFNATATPAGTINEVAVDWQSSTATWNNFGGEAGVQSDEYRASPSYAAPFFTGATAGTPISASIDVTTSLQSWSSNPALNFGWVFRPNSTDGAEVYSADQTTASQRPLLSVTYNAPTGCVNNSDCNDGNPCTTDSCDLGTSSCSYVPVTCAWGTCAPSSGQCEVTLSFQNGASGYSGTVDTYLDEANPTLSHANDVSFFMDNDPTDKQGLIRFDGIFGGNGTSQIPPGSTIRSATLTVNVNDASDTGAAFHRMLSCWDDTNTWSTFGAGIQADGIEAVATPDVPSSSNNNTPPVIHNITVTNSLAAWSAGAVNLGWAALPLGASGWGFDSAQGTIKPLLSVTFTPPPACATAADCNDGNGCTNDTCNVSTGFCSHTANVGASCSDGVACTTDTCSACGRCASVDGCTSPSVCNTGNGQCEAPPVPPSQPTNPSPADGATGVSTSPQLCVDVSDPNGDPLSVTFKGRQGGGGSGTPFTVIAMPDTQFYSESFPTTYESQTMWVRDNRIARNIVMSVGLGDCVNVADVQQQWTNANAANSILENPGTTGLIDGIPYGIAVGNHDQAPNGTARSGADENITTQLYNQTFPKSRFQGRAYFGGQFSLPGFADSMDNHYELFSASGMDFIVFHLEWDDGNCSWPANGSVPTGTLTTCQNVMVWMRDLLVNTYPDRRVIIASHFVGTPSSGGSGTMTLSNQGQAYLNLAKALPNVFMILGGHLDQTNFREDLANDGHKIFTITTDYQTRPNGGNGWLRIMTFDPVADTIHIETYSPTVEGGRFINRPTRHADDLPSATPVADPNAICSSTRTNSCNELLIPYDMDAGLPFQTIGTTTGVPSGTQTCVSWPGLTANLVHEWKVEVSDATATTTSPVRSFTTSSCTVNADCDDANVCTTDVCSGTVCSHNSVLGCCNLDADCADSNPCNGNETCSGHTCQAGTALNCDDGNPCTTDSCVDPTGCAHANNTNACNDSNACTTPDACSAGACGGSYSPTPGCCTTNANCNDGNPATTDTCTGGNCSNVANATCTTAAECDDSDACTTDTCVGGNAYALQLNGSSQRVTMGAAPGLGAQDFTLEAWIKWNGTGTTGSSGSNGKVGIPIIAKGVGEGDGSNLDANYFFAIDAAGKLVADYESFEAAVGGNNNYPVQGTTAVTINVWHHVAVTYDAPPGTGCWQLYLDGAPDTAGTTCPNLTPRYDSIQHFAIGSALTSTGTATGAFGGRIDEVRVWNVARTQAEIQATLSQPLTSGTGLVGRWGFEDGSTATDSTVPAENGTLVASPVFDSADKPSLGTGICQHAVIPNCTPCTTSAQCDDADACTTDSCVGGVCEHTALNCDDADACTTDTCAAGPGCQHAAVSCDDANACTADTCVPASGCAHANNTASCNDGNACTAPDACAAGACGGTYAPTPGCCTGDAQCNDGLASTIDSCVGGSCQNVLNPVCNTAADCNDGDVCTTDTCVGGNVAGLNFDGTNDYVTMGTSLGLGTAAFTLEGWIKRDGASWGLVTSTGGQGISGVPLISKGRGESENSNVDCNYFLGITTGGRLVADFEQFAAGGSGSWPAGQNHPICSSSLVTDQNWHHVAVTYDKAGGFGWRLYLDGADITAADGTTATCGAESTCTGAANCPQNPGVDPRYDSIQHFGLGTAMTSTGVADGFYGGLLDEVRVWNRALSQTEIQTNMSLELTGGTGLLGRWGLNENTGTTAGDSVTSPVAENGTLTNGPVWSSGDKAPLATGTCSHSAVPACCTTAAQCDDGNVCTADSCVGNACSHSSANEGGVCDDGSACTATDTCQSGVCTGIIAVVCTASDQCHDVGSCNPSTGLCSNPPKANGSACDDADACTQSNTCQSGVCIGANPVVCTASDQCHVAGTCSPSTGSCSNPPASNGTVCNDGNLCTTGDVCTAGACGGTAINCDDGNQCTADTCSAGVCQHASTPGASCDDGLVCTSGDVCSGANVTSVVGTQNCTETQALTYDGVDGWINTEKAWTHNYAPIIGTIVGATLSIEIGDADSGPLAIVSGATSLGNITGGDNGGPGSFLCQPPGFTDNVLTIPSSLYADLADGSFNVSTSGCTPTCAGAPAGVGTYGLSRAILTIQVAPTCGGTAPARSTRASPMPASTTPAMTAPRATTPAPARPGISAPEEPASALPSAATIPTRARTTPAIPRPAASTRTTRRRARATTIRAPATCARPARALTRPTTPIRAATVSRAPGMHATAGLA